MKLTDIIREVQNLDDMTQQRLLSYLQNALEVSIHSKE